MFFFVWIQIYVNFLYTFLYRYDSLTIYDGASFTSPVIGKYCSSSLPPNFNSTTNEILVHFKSDGGVEHKGFKMNYKGYDLKQ